MPTLRHCPDRPCHPLSYSDVVEKDLSTELLADFLEENLRACQADGSPIEVGCKLKRLRGKFFFWAMHGLLRHSSTVAAVIIILAAVAVALAVAIAVLYR